LTANDPGVFTEFEVTYKVRLAFATSLACVPAGSVERSNWTNPVVFGLTKIVGCEPAAADIGFADGV
jgi:hypothetical protein